MLEANTYDMWATWVDWRQMQRYEQGILNSVYQKRNVSLYFIILTHVGGTQLFWSSILKYILTW